jgi:hypothetical protein
MSILGPLAVALRAPVSSVIEGASLFDRYISTTGNDGNDGLTLGTAWLTYAPLKTLMQAANDNTSISCRVVAGAYADAGPGDIGVNINAGCHLSVYVDAGTVYTGPTGVDRSWINVTGNAWTMEVVGLGGTFTIQTYDTGTGNGLGMDSAGGATLIARDVLVQGCIDGVSLHGTNSNAQIYNCVFKSNSKSAAAHVNTGGSFYASGCEFWGNPGGATLGIYFETTANSVNTLLEDCWFVPVGTVSTERNCDFRGATLRRCRVGTTTIAATLVGSADVNLMEDTYLNASWDMNRPVAMTRCYGRAQVRQRNNAVGSTFDNCAFVDSPTGAAVDGFIWANFDPTSAANIQITNSIINGFLVAIGSGYNATYAGYWAASGSAVTNCCLFNNGTNVDADIEAADPGSIVSPLTSNPQIGAANDYEQASYGYAAGSPCIGAGTGGSNIGFAAAA